jgi:hypothetical protein
MVMTHLLRLEWVQYQALRVALGLMSIHPCNGGKLELQIPCFWFLSIGPLFEDEAWSARGAKPGSLHQGIFQFLITGYSSVQIFYAAYLGTSLIDGHMEKKLVNVQEAMYPLVASRVLLTGSS